MSKFLSRIRSIFILRSTWKECYSSRKTFLWVIYECFILDSSEIVRTLGIGGTYPSCVTEGIIHFKLRLKTIWRQLKTLSDQLRIRLKRIFEMANVNRYNSLMFWKNLQYMLCYYFAHAVDSSLTVAWQTWRAEFNVATAVSWNPYYIRY